MSITQEGLADCWNVGGAIKPGVGSCKVSARTSALMASIFSTYAFSCIAKQTMQKKQETMAKKKITKVVNEPPMAASFSYSPNVQHDFNE